MKYALDTNALSDAVLLRGRVSERLRAQTRNSLYVPAQCVYEVHYGLARHQVGAKRREAMLRLIALCTVLPFDAKSAEIAGALRADLERQGTPIGEMDGLIAATVMAHGAVLVSRNLREFARVPTLALEDWY